jgi:AcrR family transcriptional regulator
MTDPQAGLKRRRTRPGRDEDAPVSAGERTKQRLMAAAEEVFARDGVRAGSMAAILRAAGQRNEAAISYHFGSREALAVAILETRRATSAAARSQMLSEAAASGEIPTLRHALEILVLPILPLLETHSGRNYLRILAEVFRGLHRGDRLRPRPADMRQTMRLLEACLVHQPEEIAEERLLLALQLFVESSAQRAAELEIGSDHPLEAAPYAENLILVLEAILSAPVPAMPLGTWPRAREGRSGATAPPSGPPDELTAALGSGSDRR